MKQKMNDRHNGAWAFCLCMVMALESYGVSPVHNRVIDYVPAPGQFVNELPEWEDGDDAAVMAEKAYQYMVPEEAMISLGAWGGYVTVGFERTVVNVEGLPDLLIEGNTFLTENSGGESSEPGVVMVAYDLNGNGLPDESEWFEIAGSEQGNAVHDYEIRYSRPASANEDIAWTDNVGNSGYVYRNAFHSQPFWPQWLNDREELVFKGTRLPDNSRNTGTAENPYYELIQFDYGYADNWPNDRDDAEIDIDWAVDKNGNPVKMPGVDFVRIYTGVNQYNGILGECSTEVKRVRNLHTCMVGGEEIVDESIAIDAKVLADFVAEYGNASVPAVGQDKRIEVVIDQNGELSFTLEKELMVRIFSQLGKLCYSSVGAEGRNAVDMSAYLPGLYVVKIGDWTAKILKK